MVNSRLVLDRSLITGETPELIEIDIKSECVNGVHDEFEVDSIELVRFNEREESDFTKPGWKELEARVQSAIFKDGHALAQIHDDALNER
jgi:hypothetical protein